MSRSARAREVQLRKILENLSRLTRLATDVDDFQTATDLMELAGRLQKRLGGLELARFKRERERKK